MDGSIDNSRPSMLGGSIQPKNAERLRKETMTN